MLEYGDPDTEHRTLVAVNLPKAIPNLEIHRFRPKSPRRIALGWEPFDRSFLVTTDDPAFAHAVLTMPIMEWMLSDPRSQYFPILFSGTRLATACQEELDIHHVGAPADYLAELLSRIPQQVWQ